MLAERFTQVVKSIPWVRCASGNVLSLTVSIQFVSSSARVTSVKFHKPLLLTYSLPETRHIDRTRRPGSDKKNLFFPYSPKRIRFHDIAQKIYISVCKSNGSAILKKPFLSYSPKRIRYYDIA